MKIRVVTINIAGMQFDWDGKRKEALVQQLDKLSPDIVFLQEATVVPEKNYDQSADLACKLSLSSFAFAPYGNLKEYESPRLGGVAILSRFPFVHVEHRNLPPGKEKYGARVGLAAEIEVEGKSLYLLTTHLSWRRDEKDIRLAQAEELLGLTRSKENVIFGGDFNAEADDDSVEKVRLHFKDAFAVLHGTAEGNTWCKSKNDYIKRTSRGDSRIDYLFCSQKIDVEKAEVVLNQRLPVLPSDHFGVLADLHV